MNVLTEIKLALGLKNSAEEIYTEAKKMDGIKAGWRTSEFWFTVVLPKVLLTLGYLHGVIPGPIYAIVMAAIASVYILGRSAVKMVAIWADAKAGNLSAATTEINAQTAVVNK